MKAISLLFALIAVRFQHSSSSIESTDATVDSSGETSIEDSACQPLNGKITSCDTFQIATLNSSPRRCIHIEAPPPESGNEKDGLGNACTDYDSWFDGTNGCIMYTKHSDWCTQYGHFNFPSTPYKANQACCSCGGGHRGAPRLRVGEYVNIKGRGVIDDCKSLKIVEVVTQPQFNYVLEVMKPCGPKQMMKVGGVFTLDHSIKAGNRIRIDSDDPNVISRHLRVELKKCRNGREEQEFTLSSLGMEDGHHITLINHKMTGISLALALGGNSPHLNITQSFEDGLFEESDEFFFIKMISDNFAPTRPTFSYLGSGKFGETEYSEVQAHSLMMHRGFDEQEHSMWRFQRILEGVSDESDHPAVVDEHSEWLIRMTQIIGIDYLTQLPPWHLLDVDREATKSDVKSRFRELSRSFHPDKLIDQPEKKELFGRIFILLQNAYEGLKSADAENFRVKAESGSQLFAHSQYVVELLPFHWTKLNSTISGVDDNSGKGKNDRYILNAASHLDASLIDDNSNEEESDPSMQLWVTFMYSARCSMSRAVIGMVDIAAKQLEEHENIKVGAYGCGLHKEYPPEKNDPTGVTSDPICAQFLRRETPNLHVIVETIPGKKRDEKGVLVEVPPDPELIRENAQFKYFYSAVPTGNTTQFHPHNFINFALTGKRVWENSHLVHRMKKEDFKDPAFIGSISIVAYLDGTGNGETDREVADAISTALPGVARRFKEDDVYVGVALCGYGDDNPVDESDIESQKHVDCSKFDVKWLPDIKVYSIDDTVGVSLLRGKFGDSRDVEVALESAGNVLRNLIGGTDGDDEDEFEDMENDDDTVEGGGGCDAGQPPPPSERDSNFVEIEGQMEETPLLDVSMEDNTPKPELENELKPSLDQGEDSTRKPKLASEGERPQLGVGREKNRDRISGFHKRETKRRGGGKLLGGGAGSSAGLIA